MIPKQRLTMIACGATLLFAAGCGTQPSRVLAPTDPGGSVASVARRARIEGARTDGAMGECPDPSYQGPVITLTGPGLDYTYPTGGYCPCPSAEVPFDLPAHQSVTFHWSADASGSCTGIQWYRWTLDIGDVSDETPRIDEATDLNHWSVKSLGTSATIGPFSTPGEVHRFLVDVSDMLGLRSLGIIRVTVVPESDQPPDCSGAVAALAGGGPPNGSFAQVAITGVTDPDGDPVTITVTGVSQDEPVVGVGERPTCPDAVIENGVASVRRERSGTGNGRVYTIAFTADDGRGGVCDGTVDVCIPHNQGSGACVKDALSVNSLEDCGELPGRRSKTTTEP
jgi:hypothetical protein